MTENKPLFYVKDTETGEIRPSPWGNSTSRYWWTEGNGSCDCNRSRAFPQQDVDEPPPCGESRYSLVNEDGTPFTNWPPEDDDYDTGT